MLFATYIQKLHKCIEPNTDRGEFTKKIIKLIVIDEKKLEYRSMSSYYKYYDGDKHGTGKDKINSYAKTIVRFLDESEDKTKSLPKFKAYLNGLQFNTAAKNKICDSFRCELPDINVNNYIDKLSELLIRIIKEVAGDIKKENTLNTHALSEEALIENWCSQLEPPSPNFSRDELAEIEALVKKIYVILKKLANLDLYQYIEKSNIPHKFLLSKDRIIRYNQNCIPGEKYNIFLEYFKELDTLFIELKYYSELHKYAPLNEAANFFASINKDNYFLNNTNLVQLKLEIKLNFLSVAILHLRK